jgi:hypothetical protein
MRNQGDLQDRNDYTMNKKKWLSVGAAKVRQIAWPIRKYAISGRADS